MATRCLLACFMDAKEERCITIGICDDDSVFRAYLQQGIKTTKKNVRILFFANGDEVVSYMEMKNIEKFDILILDVEMPGINGIRLKDMCIEKQWARRILFLSGHQETMSLAFGINVVGFISKPIRIADVNRRIDALIMELYKNEEIRFFDGKSREVVFSLEDLLWIEAQKEYSSIVLKTHSKPILVRKSLCTWVTELNDKQVIRVHRKYMVNLQNVEKQSSDGVWVNGNKIPVGRLYKKEFQKNLQKFQLTIMRGRA